MEIQDEIKVILETDDFVTNLLLITNILVTLVVSYFVKIKIEEKIKQIEIKAHSDKISAERRIDFYVKVNRITSRICQNTMFNSITSESIQNLNSLKIDEDTIFIDYATKESFEDFYDYLINLSDGLENKDLDKEKYFFHKLREKIN